MFVLRQVQYACSKPPGNFHLGNAVGMMESNNPELFLAVAEAWAWLLREGLVVPSSTNGWYCAARRARTITTHDAMQAFIHSRLLPRAQVHATILGASSALFSKGQYDTAVFAAFKEIEIAVRVASGLPSELVGEALMRAAFDSRKGPLRDEVEDAVEGERLAVSHLFAGAIGRYRNSTGHRRVDLTGPEAVEILMLASHLMRIVEERVEMRGKARTPE